MKARANSFGFKRFNTSEKVSWLGMPCFRSKNPLNHSTLELPYFSIEQKSSQSQITAQIEIVIILTKGWRKFLLILGSIKSPKALLIVVYFIIIQAKTTICNDQNDRSTDQNCLLELSSNRWI